MKSMKGMKREFSELSNRVIGSLHVLWLPEEGNAKDRQESKGFPADLLKLSACLWS